MLYRFASMTVDICPRYRYTAELCEGYLAPEGAAADFTVRVTDEEIAREADGTRELPPAYLESLAIYRRICHEALRFDTFLFHGSALEMDGEGYLFTAPSGTGKSTHTRYWREVFGERVRVINDDKPLLRVTDGGVFVCGTPWDGKHRLSTNSEVPLKYLCLLERGEENRITPATAGEIYPAMLGQTYRPAATADMGKTLALLDRTLAAVKLYHLWCNLSPEAAKVAYRGIHEGD